MTTVVVIVVTVVVVVVFSICMVSSVTREGIKDLQERIHTAALNAKDPDTHEHVIGMQVIECLIHLLYMYQCTIIIIFLTFRLQ